MVIVQVENEYGSYYACDRKYTAWLLQLTKSLLDTEDIVYATDDGGGVVYLIA